MKSTRTFQGLEITLQAAGFGRFGGAIFLAVWLNFWAVGEAVVGWILLRGAWSLVTGQPPAEGREPLEAAPSLAVGLFLLVWLAGWTLGGVLAGRELLRVLFGKERLLVRPDFVTVERGYGLFTTRNVMHRDQVRRFYRRASGSTLSADTVRGTVELTRFGSRPEIDEIADALNQEYRLSSVPARDGALPVGWSEDRSRQGEPILIKDPVVRRKQALFAWIAFLPVALVACFLLQASFAKPSFLAIAAIVTVAAGFIGWGAYRLSHCRDEWVIGAGSLRLQRRRGSRTEPLFEAGALLLREERDSDGDLWYRLIAESATRPEGLAPHQLRRYERTLMGVSGDPADGLNLGRWLARQCGLPFRDRTTTEAKTQDADELRRQLADSGRLGAWISRRMSKGGPRSS